MTLLLITFFAGILTVLAPCILPLLPVIVGGSLTGTEVHLRKALTITLSLGLSVIAFTLLLKVSTLFINIPEYIWMWLSGGILIGFGIITVFPSLWERIGFVGRWNQESNKIVTSGYQKKSFWGDVLIGAALGPVFSTCSPTYFIVLATVLPVRPALGMLYLLSYTVGLSIALLLIAAVGQRIMHGLGAAADPRGWFKRLLGVLFLLVGLAIITGTDKTIESALLSHGYFDTTKIEQSLLQKQQPSINNTSTGGNDETSTATSSGDTTSAVDTTRKQNTGGSPSTPKSNLPKAAEITSPSGFINTGGKPITIGEFKGSKVVLVDFWTYSCINCQRTLPYMVAWYDKYHNEGLEIIGIHTPEFSFEKVQKNVEEAVARFGIKYPVVLDNNYATWNAFGNQYWPRKYLIDLDGNIIYDHIGEGNYDETERAIQTALAERAKRLQTTTTISSDVSTPQNVIPVVMNEVGSPEVYFGASRNIYLGNGVPQKSGEQTLTLPTETALNTLYLGGVWSFSPEYAQTSAPATIVFKYNAKNVYMVASAMDAATPAVITVTLDGKAIGTSAGADVSSTNGRGVVSEERLYHLVGGAQYGTHTLEIHVVSGSLHAFTFTFG